MTEAAGTVVSLARWPVKSAAGEDAPALALDARGVLGDRAHALVWAGRLLTARQAPRLLSWRAQGDPASLTAPDGRAFAWDDPALPGALAADLGREVELRRDARGQQDVPETVHLVTEAKLRAVSEELGARLDPRRFRANVVAALDAPAFAEEGWTGRRVRIGEAELEVTQPCLRCVIPTLDPDGQARSPRLLKHLVREHGGAFGVYLRPLAPATIRVGDPIAVTQPERAGNVGAA